MMSDNRYIYEKKNELFQRRTVDELNHSFTTIYLSYLHIQCAMNLFQTSTDDYMCEAE